MEIIEVPPLPLCSYKEYRGSAHRARGLKRPAKARAKSPPLSGGEVARKTEEKGRGLSERSEFRRPRRRLRRRTQKPDNSGGASWFVLLAVEKNEQIKRISVTRTFFGRERKSFVAQSSPCRVPLYCGVFLQRKNIGEVARSDGGVKEKDKKVWLFRLYRKIQSPHKSYMIYEGFL